LTEYITIMDQNNNYIKKHGKIKTVIAAGLATMVFGCAVGFGGSQLLVGIMVAVNGINPIIQEPENTAVAREHTAVCHWAYRLFFLLRGELSDSHFTQH